MRIITHPYTQRRKSKCRFFAGSIKRILMLLFFTTTSMIGAKAQNSCNITGVGATPPFPSAAIYTCTQPPGGALLSYQANPTLASIYSWSIFLGAPFPNTSGAFIVGSTTGQTVTVNPGPNAGSFFLICQVTQIAAPNSVSSCAVSVQVYKPEVTPIGASRCGPGSVTLNSSGCTLQSGTVASNVKWYDAPVGGTLLHTGTTFTTPSITATTSYWAECDIMVTPQLPSLPFNCISPRVEIVATVKQLLVSFASSNSPICPGSALNLFGPAGMSNYAWTGPNGFNSSLQNPVINNASMAAFGAYSLTVTNTDGCLSSDNTFVIIDSLITPLVNVTPSSQTICSGNMISQIDITNPNAIAGTLFSWVRTNTANLSGIAVNGIGSTISGILTNNTNTQQSTVFTITATAPDGCYFTSTATVIVNPVPSVNATPVTQVVCSGTAITNVANTNPNGVSGTTFSWTRTNTVNLTGIAASGTGSPITGTFTNTTTAQQTTIFTITATAGSCTSNTTVVVIVNPRPSVNVTNTNQTICSGTSIADIAITNPNAVSGTTFNWTRTNTGNLTGIAASGTGTPISGVLTNNTNTQQTTVFTITATSPDGCFSSTSATVIVNPTPTVNATPVSQTTCSGTAITNIAITNPNGVSGTTFSWTRTNTGNLTGIAASGSGSSISGTITNNTSVQQTTIFTITAMAAGCSSFTTATIIVSPVPAINQPGNQTICAGALTTIPVFSGSANSYDWTNSNTAIGLGAGGTGNLPTFVAANGTNVPISGTIIVTPRYISGGVICTGDAKNFTITVNPVPAVNQPNNQTVCAGSATTAVSFIGTGTSYSWTNSNSAIGLAASGIDHIPSFTAINTTNAPISGTITVTPQYTSGGVTCTGSEKVFTITVNPAPEVNQPENETLCAGDATTEVTFIGTATSFNWSNSNTAIGLNASGSGNIPSFTATNNTTVPISGTITVTPVYVSGGVTCTGTSKTFTKTVNPTPSVNQPGNQVVCSGESTAAVSFFGTATSFTWTNNNTAIGLGASGIDIIPAFTATNTTNVPISGTITVTPIYSSGNVNCMGQAKFFTITVNPAVSAGMISGASPLCAGAVAAYTSNGTSGGVWISSNTTVATVNLFTGMVTATGAGTTEIIYALNSGCGSPVSTSKTLTVNSIVNDDAPGAILLAVGSGCTGSPYSNACATQSSGEPFAACKGTAGYKTLWFKFIAPASGNVRVSNDYSGGTMDNDSRLALFSAGDVNNYATFTNIACDDDNGVIKPERSILYATGLIPGNTYYIQVDGKNVSTTAGSFCLTVDELTSEMLSNTTSCTPGQPLISVNDNYSGWQSLTDAGGKLMALISNNSGGATTSTYTGGVNIHAGSVRQDPVSLQHYMDRNFFIYNPAVSNANVRFFFLNTELTALQSADPGVTPANLQVLKQSGINCENNFVAVNGINNGIAQTGNGSSAGFRWVQVTAPELAKFFLYTPKAFLPVKVYLQGAYSTSLARHKDVTATWAGILNTQAFSQPYNVTPFSYTGTEAAPPGFFTSTAAATDILDWVLLELRDAANPSIVITRKAAFIREDGRIVDLDGVSDLSFRNISNGNYHLAIHHRNHLGVRTASVRALNGTMGNSVPPLFDFSLAQSQAYQDLTITSNSAMKDLPGGVSVLWGGNCKQDFQVRVTGLQVFNDYLFLLINTMGGDLSTILTNMYHSADMNMDGQVRATGLSTFNDFLFLVNSVMGGDLALIIAQHQ